MFKRLRFAIPVIFILLAGCQASPTFLKPFSSVSDKQANLYWTIFYMALLVFVLVWAVLIINIVRFRRRSNQTGQPVQKYGNWRLEVVWTALPVLLVLILFVLTVSTLNATAAPKAAAGDVNIHVIGHQWWWEFQYPDQGFTTANEMHVPSGATVHLTLDSVDVIHSFWVPQLSGKIDVIPGQTNTLWFNADQQGVYDGQCSEFCGTNHANMRIKVIVQPEAEYTAWVSGQQAPPYQPANDLEQKGYTIITAGICSECHQLGDNQPKKPIAPNLSHLMSRSVFAGATFPLNEQNLRSWITNNQAMKPGNDMLITVKPGDVDAILAYLLKLK